mgnify:CR=1 FL=1
MKKNIIAIAVLIALTVGLGYLLAGGTKTVKNEKQSEKINLFNPEGEKSQSGEEQMIPPAEENIINNNEPKQGGAKQKVMKATLETNKGNITIELNTNTPKTTANFVKLAKEGFYNGTKFHRVIAGFMNQGGDPLSKDDSKMNQWGTGGPGYKFDDEITSANRNDKWTISMANAGPNTGSSQFFINLVNNNFLDGKHPVFGKVVEGMEVVDKIAKVEKNSQDKPLEDVVINKASLV